MLVNKHFLSSLPPTPESSLGGGRFKGTEQFHSSLTFKIFIHIYLYSLFSD